MPAYNAGPYIKEAIQSVIGQTYTNWELIIVNDGSTDDTASVINAFADSRIKTFYQENKGQCAAANKAFELSGGALIKFFDADDILSLNHLQLQIEQLNGAKNTIAYSDWGRFYGNDLNTFKLDESGITGDMEPLKWLISSLDYREPMFQCARWLIPREILLKAGLWLEELSLINDFEFIIRVLLHADKLVYAKGCVLYYRSGLQKSLSSSIFSEKAAQSAYTSFQKGTAHLLRVSDTCLVRRIAADCYQHFIYEFYPRHKLLVNMAEAQVKVLGGSSLKFKAGGLTKIFCFLFGWKLTKRIKQLIR